MMDMPILFCSALSTRGRIPKHVWLFDLYTISPRTASSPLEVDALFCEAGEHTIALSSLLRNETGKAGILFFTLSPSPESVVRPGGTRSFVGGHLLCDIFGTAGVSFSWAAGGCWGDRIGKKGMAVSFLFRFIVLGLNDDEERRGFGGGGDYGNWISAWIFPLFWFSLLVWPGYLQFSHHQQQQHTQHCKRRRITTMGGWMAGWVLGEGRGVWYGSLCMETFSPEASFLLLRDVPEEPGQKRKTNLMTLGVSSLSPPPPPPP